MDKEGLYFEDGRQALLIASGNTIFGRNRDNDVALRFSPRSEKNDDCSRAISRTHFRVELSPPGMQTETAVDILTAVATRRCGWPAGTDWLLGLGTSPTEAGSKYWRPTNGSPGGIASIFVSAWPVRPSD